MSTTLPRPVRSTTPRTRPAGSARGAHASDYTELTRRIKAAGLLERRPGWYALRVSVLAVLLAGGIAALFLLGDSWWQLLLAVYFGALFTQIAFLCHDGAHRQMFVSGKRGEWFSRIVGNGLVGLSYGWWMNKHSKHHANPNTLGKDGDIVPGAIVFTPQDAAQHTGRRAWWMARQGWFFFPILLLAGADLHLSAIKAVLRGEVKHRFVEGGLIALRLVGFPVLVLLAAGPVVGIAFLLVQIGTFGFTMAGAFAPNHKGMDLIEEHERVDYLRRQVRTSRNVTGGWVIDKAMGGLNFQIEHHLFPNMPSVNLKRARPIVKQYCAELGVPYVETSLLRSWRIVVQYIHRVGIKHADPFDCPAAAAFRAA